MRLVEIAGVGIDVMGELDLFFDDVRFVGDFFDAEAETIGVEAQLAEDFGVIDAEDGIVRSLVGLGHHIKQPPDRGLGVAIDFEFFFAGDDSEIVAGRESRGMTRPS